MTFECSMFSSIDRGDVFLLCKSSPIKLQKKTQIKVVKRMYGDFFYVPSFILYKIVRFSVLWQQSSSQIWAPL